MQWLTLAPSAWANSSSESAVTANWPIPFPNAIISSVTATPKIAVAANNADTWLQVVTYSQTQITIQRQGSNSGGSHTTTGLLIGWGY